MRSSKIFGRYHLSFPCKRILYWSIHICHIIIHDNFIMCWQRKSIATHYIQLFRKGPLCVVILQVSSQWALMYHPWNISWYHKKNHHFKRSWTFDYFISLLVMKPKFSVRIRSISWPIPYMSCRRQYPGPRFNRRIIVRCLIVSLEAARLVVEMIGSRWNLTGACQISERSGNSKHQSRGFETYRDLTIRLKWGLGHQ